jgi:hypothetical protein
MKISKKVYFLPVLLIGVFLIQGCSIYSSRLSAPVLQVSKVVLRENDFEYVSRNLRGTYMYWSIDLGLAPFFVLSIPLDDPRLFSNALADLYSKAKRNTEGEAAQMINWTLDSERLVIPIPYISPTRNSITFRADLIRYTK